MATAGALALEMAPWRNSAVKILLPGSKLRAVYIGTQPISSAAEIILNDQDIASGYTPSQRSTATSRRMRKTRVWITPRGVWLGASPRSDFASAEPPVVALKRVNSAFSSILTDGPRAESWKSMSLEGVRIDLEAILLEACPGIQLVAGSGASHANGALVDMTGARRVYLEAGWTNGGAKSFLFNNAPSGCMSFYIQRQTVGGVVKFVVKAFGIYNDLMESGYFSAGVGTVGGMSYEVGINTGGTGFTTTVYSELTNLTACSSSFTNAGRILSPFNALSGSASNTIGQTSFNLQGMEDVVIRDGFVVGMPEWSDALILKGVTSLTDANTISVVAPKTWMLWSGATLVALDNGKSNFTAEQSSSIGSLLVETRILDAQLTVAQSLLPALALAQELVKNGKTIDDEIFAPAMTMANGVVVPQITFKQAERKAAGVKTEFYHQILAQVDPGSKWSIVVIQGTPESAAQVTAFLKIGGSSVLAADVIEALADRVPIQLLTPGVTYLARDVIISQFGVDISELDTLPTASAAASVWDERYALDSGKKTVEESSPADQAAFWLMHGALNRHPMSQFAAAAVLQARFISNKIGIPI